ncbi:phage tail-collar fiber domain-containing protein [Paenibacillus sp. DMB20]|uniref:phage tail-collar fiber domain-containing protein n=1 Tax=Paenibacillus sp. DMB20 TaxID=1642570 RepID=UPI000699BC86|nr:phage tail protein [Paenibacillus sp. DMB20]
MGAFGGFIQTNKGRNLQAKAEAGTLLKFTRMGVGDGQLGGQSIPSLNKLIHETMSLPITRLKPQLPAQAIVGAVLSNQDVTTGFYFRELGIFAQDPDEGEILYAYGNSGSGAEYIPPAGTADIIEKTIDMIVTFGQAQNVSAVINSSLIFATPDDVAEALTESKKYTDQKVLAAETPSGQATGTVVNGNTVYTAALSPALTTLKAFQRVVVKSNVASTGSPTFNFDGLGAKAALKANGSAASFKANGVYTLVYDGTAFILQGEGGEYGTAQAWHVLEGYTIGTENGVVPGEIPIQEGGQDAPYTSQLGKIIVQVPTGYWGPTRTAYASDPYFVPSSIRGDRTLFGMKGDANVVDTRITLSPAAPADIVKGKTAYVNGQFLTGQMPNRSAENEHMPGLDSTVWAGDRFFIRPPNGYFNGSTWVTAAVPGLTANNLRAGVNVAGLIGTLIEGKKYATGSIGSLWRNTSASFDCGFAPAVVLVFGTYSGSGQRASIAALNTPQGGGGTLSSNAPDLSFGAGASAAQNMTISNYAQYTDLQNVKWEAWGY